MKTTEIQQKYKNTKEICRQLSSCNRIKYILLLNHTMGSCTGTALCRSLLANSPCCTAHRCCTTVLHTQVLQHCTAHNGAVTLYCKQVMLTCTRKARIKQELIESIEKDLQHPGPSNESSAPNFKKLPAQPTAWLDYFSNFKSLLTRPAPIFGGRYQR